MTTDTQTFYLYGPAPFDYLGPYVAQESPRRKGDFIRPESAADDAPPPYDAATETCRRQIASATWLVEAIPVQAPETDAPAAVEMTLDDAKAFQISTLSAACQAEIYTGFASAALGNSYFYPMADKDQMNLAFAVSASLSAGSVGDWKTQVWCKYDDTWGLTDHTAAQIQQVNADGQLARVDCMKRNAALSVMVNAIVVATGTDEAAAIVAVQAISWATEILPPAPAPTEPADGDVSPAPQPAT